MKKLFTLILLAVISFAANSQTLLNEQFNSGTFPPSGWTIDTQSGNWSAENSNNAGGVAPEARLNWSPQFSGYSRLISPATDLSGINQVRLEFKHSIDDYSGGYTIGVATRIGTTGDWTDEWTYSVNGSVTKEEISLLITNNTGSPDFQFCIYFNGPSYNLNYWYIDDVKLSAPFAHDVAATKILVPEQLASGTEFTPAAKIFNAGLNNESFNAVFKIMDINSNVIYENTQTVNNLLVNASDSVAFGTFTLPDPDQLYTATCITQLSGDMDPENDTMAKIINTYTRSKNNVVLEIGTGTWCQYCPGAALGADDLVENGKNVAVIEYHNGDNYVNDFSDPRIDYYGISGFPTAVFDGTLMFIGGDHTQSMYEYYLPLYEQMMAKKTPFSIEIAGSHTGNDYSVVVTADKHAPITYNNLVAHLVITESNIPENWQGQTELDFVERLMTPGLNGTPLDFSQTNHIEIPLTFTLDPSWVTENCEIVAFIQNLDNKEIYQGIKVAVNELSGVGINDNQSLNTNLSIFPNPVSSKATINYSIQGNNNIVLEIRNLSGQIVKTFVNSKMEAGYHSIVWNGSDNNGKPLSNGLYFCTLRDGNSMKVQKITLVK